MKRLIILLGILWGGSVYGQQLPQFTQFQQNKHLINPAAVGADDFVNISLGGRWQWTGFSDSPKTSFLSLATPSNKLRRGFMRRTFGKIRRNSKSVKHPKMRITNIIHAYGANLIADQFGAFRTMTFNGSYAVHLPINNDYKLSFGTSVGLGSNSFLADKAQVLTSITGTGFDAVYNAQATAGAQYIMNVNAGMHFYGNGFYAGVSAYNLTKDLVRFGNLNTTFSPRMHFYGMTGYRFVVNSGLNVTPGILVKYVPNTPLSIEANIIMDFNEKFWLGASYRHLDAVAMLAGMKFSEKFRIGYSFDLSVSRLIAYNSGGHELVFTYMIGNSRNSASRF